MTPDYHALAQPAGSAEHNVAHLPIRPTGGAAPACYTELTAHQFAERKDLVVLLLKAPYAAHDFAGFRGVVPLPNGQVVSHYVAEFGRGQPIGLVCNDGECSSRVAIRLARAGYAVHHLAGGLREWNRLQRMGKQG